MEIYEAITRRRTIRRFAQRPIPFKALEKLIRGARLAPSAANLQPLEYLVVDDQQTLPSVFATLKWAAYIAPAGDPPPGFRPVVYIVILVNKSIRDSDYERDVGAAAENILLAAWEEGIGTCWMTSVERKKLRKSLEIRESHIIDSVIALGYKAEEPRIEELTNSVRYWKDESEKLHVPKRPLKDILHRNKF